MRFVKFLIGVVKWFWNWKIIQFIRWKIIDIRNVWKNGRQFEEYGLTIFCGRQGSGKTVAMTEYLERMRQKYPECIIITNYFYRGQDRELCGWQDFMNVRNGKKGVIFAVDEIQNEWSNDKWKDFPEFLLAEITQQRKQRIKIVATSQIFTRVVKQLREQTFEVVECYTLLGRWTFTKCFDAEDYNSIIDKPEKKLKLARKWRRSFIQTDKFRGLFDSYAKIERLKNTKFIPRIDRVS